MNKKRRLSNDNLSENESEYIDNAVNRYQNDDTTSPEPTKEEFDSRWKCIEIDELSRRLIIFDDFSNSSSSIGDTVEHQLDGKKTFGTLMGNSEMGITAMDLFNTILTSSNDIEYFIRQNGITPSEDSPGRLIQAYLLFCRKSVHDVWTPINEVISNDPWSECEVEEIDNDSDISFGEENLSKQTQELTSTVIYCEECDKQFATNRNLRRHIQVAHKKLLRCEDCDETFTALKPLKDHVKKEHTSAIMCDQCDKTFKTRNQYSIHVQRIHEKIKNYFCDICDYKCFEKHSLNAHLTTHNPEAKTFLCDQCSSAFARMGHLSRHKKEVHLKEKLQKCSDCPMEYQTRTELKNHLIQVHEMRIFSCDQCDNFFKRAFYLKLHKERVHEKLRNYHCNLCEYSCYSRDLYELHNRRHHNGERTFPCSASECLEMFLTSANAIQHEYKCTFITVKYSCDTCSKQFTREKALYTHCIAMKHQSEGIVWNSKGYIPKSTNMNKAIGYPTVILP